MASDGRHTMNTMEKRISIRRQNPPPSKLAPSSYPFTRPPYHWARFATLSSSTSLSSDSHRTRKTHGARITLIALFTLEEKILFTMTVGKLVSFFSLLLYLNYGAVDKTKKEYYVTHCFATKTLTFQQKSAFWSLKMRLNDVNFIVSNINNKEH